VPRSSGGGGGGGGGILHEGPSYRPGTALAERTSRGGGTSRLLTLAPEPPSLPRQSQRHCDKPGIEVDAHGDAWLHVIGKGAKAGKVVLPSSVRRALDQHLVQRGCP
jgi:hypothetical protein